MDAVAGFDRRTLERARLSRDARFDGRFFIAVTSTRIYCRPICPSPSSKAANVRYYPTAAAAAEAGYRPCLRCRPEAAPGTPAWLGTCAVVRRALRMIHDGFLDGASVERLAATVGVGPRHLHRLFLQHVGASPVVVAQTRRLQFAKRLLDETDLAMIDIALASGYRSLRRFNDAFRNAYGRPPRELRRARGTQVPELGEVRLELAFRPPYDWEFVAGYLARHAVPGVECVEDQTYSRTIAVGGGHATIEVRPVEGEHALELRVRGAPPGALFHVSSVARRMFDLAADPARIAGALRADVLMAPLVRRRPGMRIVGVWDPFECAVRYLVGATDPSGKAIARLVQVAGRAIDGAGGRLTHVFPAPRDLAAKDLGAALSAHEAAALRMLAGKVVSGEIDFGAPAEEVTARLAALPGFDPWTVACVALRGLGEPDAFPGAGVDLRRAAGGGVVEMEGRAEAWRPWRGYAAFHLSASAGPRSDTAATHRWTWTLERRRAPG